MLSSYCKQNGGWFLRVATRLHVTLVEVAVLCNYCISLDSRDPRGRNNCRRRRSIRKWTIWRLTANRPRQTAAVLILLLCTGRSKLYFAEIVGLTSFSIATPPAVSRMLLDRIIVEIKLQPVLPVATCTTSARHRTVARTSWSVGTADVRCCVKSAERSSAKVLLRDWKA